jgi:hypothetical protein
MIRLSGSALLICLAAGQVAGQQAPAQQPPSPYFLPILCTNTRHHGTR